MTLLIYYNNLFESVCQMLDEYAKRLIELFVEDVLEGDLDNLVSFNLNTIKDNTLYGYAYGGAYCPEQARIVRAIMLAVFGNLWPDITLDSFIQHEYSVERINFTTYIFGANIGDEYFKGLNKFQPTKTLHDRCVEVNRLMYTIGNYWILPCGVTPDLGTYRYHWMTDLYLSDMFKVLTDNDDADPTLKRLFDKSERAIEKYHSADGFKKLMRGMMMNKYLYRTGEPKDVLPRIWSMKQPMTMWEYFDGVEKYCKFMEEFIPKRGQKIVDKLKKLLNNTL